MSTAGLSVVTKIVEGGTIRVESRGDGDGANVIFARAKHVRRNGAERVNAPTTVIVLTTSDEERDKVETSKLNAAGDILEPMTPAACIGMMATVDKYWTVRELA